MTSIFRIFLKFGFIALTVFFIGATNIAKADDLKIGGDVPDPFTITASASPGGTVSPDGIVKRQRYSSITFSFLADTGYHLTDVLVDSQSVGTPANYTFTNLNSNHSLYVVFAINSFTIDASILGSGGKILPSGQILKNYGESQLFTILPDPGFYIDDVFLDGVSIGMSPEILLDNINANHKIIVSFLQKEYTILTTFPDNVRIIPNGPVTVKHGDNIKFRFEVDAGFEISKILVDGQDVDQQEEYEFQNVTANHELEIQTKPISALTEVANQVIDVITKTGEAISNVAKPISQVIESMGVPEKAVPGLLNTTSAVAVGIGIVTAPLIDISIFSSEIVRSILYAFFSFGSRKRRKKWGKIIESETGLPIANANVKLFQILGDESNQSKKMLYSAYTDKDGNFAFIVQPGKFVIEVMKSNFKAVGTEGFYKPGEIFEVSNEQNSLITKVIAMTYLGRDQRTTVRLSRIIFLSYLERVIPYVSLFFLILSTFTTVDSLSKSLNTASLIMAFVCLLLWIITVYNLKKRSPWGKIVDLETKEPISLALVRFVDAKDGHLAKTTVSDQKGKYQAVVPIGRYKIIVNKEHYKLDRDILIDTKDKIDLVNKDIGLTPVS